MLDTRLRLTVFTSNTVSAVETFTDQTAAAADFGLDTFTATLATTSFMYMAYPKPFGAAYIELPTANESTNTLALQYWNGSAWTVLALNDKTVGLTRSGFFGWDRPTDWAANTINGVNAYFVRLSPSNSQTEIEVGGLNLVYASDYDLKLQFPAATDPSFLPAGELSHIKMHVASRDQLIQDLRNKGYLKFDATGNWINLTPWDLHDINEVRQAAVFLALSKVFFNYSDDPVDHWSAKSKYYEAKYRNALDTVKVSYDVNDDGLETKPERLTTRVTRLYR